MMFPLAAGRGASAPVPRVHCDYTADGAPRRLRQLGEKGIYSRLRERVLTAAELDQLLDLGPQRPLVRELVAAAAVEHLGECRPGGTRPVVPPRLRLPRAPQQPPAQRGQPHGRLDAVRARGPVPRVPGGLLRAGQRLSLRRRGGGGDLRTFCKFVWCFSLPPPLKKNKNVSRIPSMIPLVFNILMKLFLTTI